MNPGWKSLFPWYVLSSQSTAFSPTGISGLALWLDASDSSTITLDGSNNVSQWNDKSGNGRNATQATTLKRPSYPSSSWNGLNAVVFDGVDDNLSTAAFTFGNYTIFGVVSRPWSVNQYRGWFGHGYAGTSGKGTVQAQDNVASSFNAGETCYFGDGFNAGRTPRAFGAKPAVSDNIPVCFAARIGGSTTARVNGIANTRIADNGTSTTASNAFVVGSTGESTDRWNGRVCELVLYSRELTDAEIVSVENYLRAKWGTS